MLKDIESFVKDDIKVNRLVYGCTKNTNMRLDI